MRRLGSLWVPGDGAPNVITQKTLVVPMHTMGASLAGRFKWELGRNLDCRAPGYSPHREVILAGGHWQNNLITDDGLNFLGSGVGGAQSLINFLAQGHMAVGTGSAAPGVTDGSLVAEIERTNSTGGFDSTDGFVNNLPTELYGLKTYTRLFVEGEANGNLTEFGLFNQSSGGTMWNRALFLDSPGGSPTTIVKTAADQLRITYEMRNYPPLGSLLENGVTIGVTVTNIETLAANCTANAVAWFESYFSSTGFFSYMGREPTTNAFDVAEANVVHTNITDGKSASDPPDTVSVAAYVGDSFYRECEVIYEPPNGNYASGIGSLFHTLAQTTSQNFVSYFSTKIPKTDTERLTLEWRHSWFRNTTLTNPATP